MAWTRGSSTWDTYRGGGLSATDLRALASIGGAQYTDVGSSRDQISGVSAGMSVVYISGLESLEHVLLSSVGLVTKAMARAILNRSQMHVPYDTGQLYQSAELNSYGLKEAALSAASPKVAFAGLGGIDENYLPESITPGKVLAEAKFFGFTQDEIDDQIEWRVEYTEQYALTVHEGVVYGREVQHWTPRSQTSAPQGMGEPTSHFLSNAFVAMAQKQPLLVRGVMQTTLQRLRQPLEARIAAGAAAEAAHAEALARASAEAKALAMRPRLVKRKV